MNTEKKLKRYRLKINPKTGAVVDFISQVEDPAIERGFLKFSKKEMLQVNDEKMELFGPVLIPDMPIYRVNEELGEYEVYFTVEDIREIEKNFMKSGFQNNVNLDHTSEMASSYVFESFISDELIPNPQPFKDLPLGTWFVRQKVDDIDVWNDIKSGKRNGFSIEGMFEYIIDEFEKNYLENHKSDTTNILKAQEKITIETMFKSLFKKAIIELSQELADTVDYKKVNSSDYKITSREVGQKVEITDTDNKLVNAPDGAYELEDGFKFTVKDGLIESIEGQDAKVEEQGEETSTEETATQDDTTSTDPAKEIEDLKTQIADLQTQIDEIKAMCQGAATEEGMKSEMAEIKNEFKSVFEKFTKIPAEESKVSNSNLAKDIKRKNFEQFLLTIKK
jgi:hypothetical protein